MPVSYKYFLLLFLVFLGLGELCAQENALDKKITLFIHEQPTQLHLQKIEELAGLNFSYDPSKIPLLRIATVAAKQEPISEILRRLFKGTNVEFRAVGKHISLFRDKLPKYTISGYLREANSGEALLGGSIFEGKEFRGTASNSYGFYSLTLQEGNYQIHWDFLGYTAQIDTIYLTRNLNIDVSLQSGKLLDEIIVFPTQDSSSVPPPTPEKVNVNSRNLVEYPTIMGERDPLRVVALFPGVQSGGEGANGLSIRGGGPDQNLVLLDGVPIYNGYHLFGFLSVFNGHAVNSAEVIKGGFPARYGGRLSSVLDVRMKEGNNKEFHGGLSLGLISGGLDLEGPLVKDRTSFFISGRRTWLDLLARGATRIANSDLRGSYGFYDFNIKLNHKISPKSRLYISTFFGKDRAVQQRILEKEATKSLNETSQYWGNKIASLRYNFLFTPKLFSNTTLTYSNYDYGLRNYSTSDKTKKDTDNIYVFDFRSYSRIHDFGIKHDFDYIPSDKHYVRFGGTYIFHYNHPSNTRRIVNEMGQITKSELRAFSVNSHEFNFYFEDDILIHPKIKINPGIHLAGISVKSDSIRGFHTYIKPQFRFSSIYQITAKHSLKIAYSGMAQFIHLLSDPSIGFPRDLWVPSTKKIAPAYSHQVTIGYELKLKPGISYTMGAFYKRMNNLLEYKNGATFFSNNTDWETQVTSGKGHSYGGEFLLRKHFGNFQGWVSYTLSWSERNFETLNNGKNFPFRFDSRHNINAVLNYQIKPTIDLGAVWSYGSGTAATLSLERYLSLDATNPFFEEGGAEIFDLSERNNYRMPAYHRLDISANFYRKTKRGRRIWTIGLINVYNRKNPFTIYPRKINETQVEVIKFSMLPVPLPYATYSFRF